MKSRDYFKRVYIINGLLTDWGIVKYDIMIHKNINTSTRLLAAFVVTPLARRWTIPLPFP